MLSKEQLKRNRAYKQKNKIKIKEQKRIYHIKNIIRIKKQKLMYRNKNIIIIKEKLKFKFNELRNEVIRLYSHGMNCCMHCRGKVEHLHHENPKDGKLEKKEFGTNTSPSARRHQIEMYTINPTYIIPLCKKCHRKAHKKLKGKVV